LKNRFDQRFPRVINTYRSLLSPAPSSTGIDGYQEPVYADLSSYIKSLGGLTRATYNDNEALKRLLGGVGQTISDYKTLVNISSASAMNTDLYTLCRASSTIIGDIIRQRNLCTTRALRLIAEASAATVKLRFVIGDVFNAIGNANDLANDEDTKTFMKSTFTNEFYPKKTWTETHVSVANDMFSELDAFIKVMSQSVFDNPVAGTTLASVALGETPADGLAPALLNNIKLAGCSKSFEGKSFAAIESWVVQGAQPSPYITTQCQGRNNELVYSRFHYTTDVGNNNTVLNMLGVLIKPAKVVESWNNFEKGYGAVTGDLIGSTYGGTGYDTEKVCLDGGDGRCDWWMVVPGDRAVVKTPDGVIKETTVGFNQVRSHTSLVSNTAQQKVPVNETFVYNPPINDRIVHPVTKPMGRDAGYQPDASSQYLFGSRWTVSPQTGDLRDQDYQDGYLTYTWVTDKRLWDAVPDRRYTRTVAMKVGQLRREEMAAGKTWNTYVAYACITSDCNKTFPSWNEGYTLTYTDGPKIQWSFFMGEWGRWHMFVDGKSSDGRPLPERR
jgi:hypothetical protein